MVSPTILSGAESVQEGSDTIVPGWTQESMDAAWRQFQPHPRRRLVEPHETILAAFDVDFRSSSGSGSDRGSIRTVRSGSVMVVEPGDEHDNGTEDESGSSNSSTGTVRYVGEPDDQGCRL